MLISFSHGYSATLAAKLIIKLDLPWLDEQGGGELTSPSASLPTWLWLLTVVTSGICSNSVHFMVCILISSRTDRHFSQCHQQKWGLTWSKQHNFASFTLISTKLGGEVCILLLNSHGKFHATIFTHCWNTSRRHRSLLLYVHPEDVVYDWENPSFWPCNVVKHGVCCRKVCLSIRPSVRPSVCLTHSWLTLLNGSKYRKTLHALR